MNKLKIHLIRMGILLLLLSLLSLPVMAQNAHVEGVVFLDSNANGMMDANEKPLQGVSLSLCVKSDIQEAILDITTTNEEGVYRFSNLAPGEYYLLVKLADDQYFVSPVIGGSQALPTSGNESRTLPFSIKNGESARLMIGATRASAYLNATAFLDLNMNGGRMSNEPLLKDVELTLLFEYEGQEYPVASAKTDREGFAQIRGLTSAVYRLAVNMPSPYIVGPLGAKVNAFYNVAQATEGTQGISKPFRLERSLGVGIGGVKTGSLEGHIWFDSNMNGLQEEGESGLSGINITLTHQEMGLTRNLTSDASGQYRFDLLQPGEYELTATLPEGVMFTPKQARGMFSDGYSPAESANISIKEGLVSLPAVIGVMPASSISVHVFQDTNFNGKLDEGEKPYPGAVLEAFNNNTLMASATSDDRGMAVLSRVRSGDHTLRLSLQDGHVFSVPGDKDGNAFSALTAVSQVGLNKEVAAGEALQLKAGVTHPAAIKGSLFEDSDLSGIKDQKEKLLPGFTVQAINQKGEVAAQTQTDATGAYVLKDLIPAPYHVRILLVSPYVFSQPSATGSGMENKVTSQTVEHGQTDSLYLMPGETTENVDAGIFRSAVINGSILLGDDNIAYKGDQGGLAQVQITLVDEEDKAVSAYTVATSGPDGAFSLKGALPGKYRLRYVLPEDSKFTKPMQDENIYLSPLFELKASDVLAQDALFAVKTGTISGQAFVDENLNNRKDEKEADLPGAQILLTNQESLERYETQSDQDGHYQISGIRPGTYQVNVILPSGLALDHHQKSLVPASIDGQSETILSVPLAFRLTDTLLSAVRPLALNGFSFYDQDLNQAHDPAVDTPYQARFSLTHLRTKAVYQVECDANGAFSLPMVFPGEYRLQAQLSPAFLLTSPQNASQETGLWTVDLSLNESNPVLMLGIVEQGSIKGTVWNMDGSQLDIAGLEIGLMDQSGKTLLETTTNEDGSYQFDNLLPISYVLSAKLPQHYRFARQVDTKDRLSLITTDLPDVKDELGMSQAFKLAMGENKTGLDIGIGSPGRLGDFAWLDLDQDGMQDAGEPGIPDLLIHLYQHGQLAATAKTDAYGRYLISDLYPGTYQMEVTFPSELKPTIIQTSFPLVASVLGKTEGQTAQAEGIVVPSGGRNLNCDLGFVLVQEGRLPASLENLPQKDWTRVNEQKPAR